VGYAEPEWHPERNVGQEFIEEWRQRSDVRPVRFKGLLRADGARQTGKPKTFQASMAPAAAAESANALTLRPTQSNEDSDSDSDSGSESEDRQA
jgi:hypothetical protein